MHHFKLDKFQKEAIEWAKKDYSVIVSAPTGAGKTLIAEQIIELCLKKNKGVIYTAPIKALSNQKFRDFAQKYPSLTGILTGDVSINPSAPILIMTTEIFRNAILIDPDEFKNREWVIFDEIHYLDDVERGTVWEETLILLPSNMKILALSATIPNINEFVKWISSIHNFKVKSIVEKKRPVPLYFIFQANNQFYWGFEQLKNSSLFTKKNTLWINKPNKMSSLIKLLKNNSALPCIYFSFSRRRCEYLAQDVMEYNLLKEEEKERITLIFNNLINQFNINKDQYVNLLYPLIRKGIAYHHAGLLPTLKEIIERLFTTGLLKLIFTTETFALGINMPARTVVFDTISKYYGRYHRYLKTRDFYQMAGRAGRRGIDKKGYVILRINPLKVDLEAIENIVYGEYEPIKSQLRSCYATILNLYRIMGNRIYDIYPKTFHYVQQNIISQKEALGLLKRKVSLLKELRYIIDKDLSWKAELASRVYGFELQMGELFEKNFFQNLDIPTLFMVITALVYEPRKGEKKPNLTKKTRKIKRYLDRFIRDIHRKERQFRIYPLSKKFYFHMSEACRAWVEGMDFYQLTKFTSADEGETVRYFRMSIQVLKEIKSSPVIDKDVKEKIDYCIKIVNRDVVDAEKQLRQEL